MTSQIFRLTNLETEKIGPVLWRLSRPLIFKDGDMTITVPVNFITDGASCPKILWALCSPMSGPQAEAAVLHDYLYSKDSESGYFRHDVDKIFFEAMVANSTNGLKARLIYRGVRLGGGKSFKKCHSIDKIRE